MPRSFMFIIFLFLTADCIEPYNFRIKNDLQTLVVQAQISNASYTETIDYPSDGRYFSAKLSYSSDVTNIHDDPISNAAVILYNDLGNSWIYAEEPSGSGRYYLYDDHFKASADRRYKLQIHLADGTIYESSLERSNETVTPKMGEIKFEEISKQLYKIELGEQTIKTKNGINVGLTVPPNEQKKALYYRWHFEPTWKYTAPFGSIVGPNYTCWVTSKYYLNNYTLLEDNLGGYRQELFFMETTRNDRIYEKMSVLVTQFSMTEAYYNYWNEMKNQSQNGGLFDAPPFNLNTNIQCLNCDAKVSGYFGVVEEQTKRWYFNPKDLSYVVVNTLRADCSVPFQDPGPECYSCLEYPFGNSSNVKPNWWM